MIRKVILGSSTLVLSAVPLKAAAPSDPPPPQDDKKEQGDMICRPSELPYYPSPTSTVSKLDLDEVSEFEKTLMEPVRIVRTTVVTAVNQVKDVASQVHKTVNDTSDQFSFLVAYLREEDNEAQRIGATAMGTLTGFIFGLRGGIIKKVTYSLLGTAAMGSLCYPEEASQYLDQSVDEGKHLAQVLYNFAMGVKPGDVGNTISDIKIPKSFSELFDMANESFRKSRQEKSIQQVSEDKTKEP